MQVPITPQSWGLMAVLPALSATVSQPTELFANATGGDEICDRSDGVISSAPSGGTMPYTYAWSSGGSGSSESGLAAGTYTVTITDGNSCVASETATVGTIVGPSASASVTADESCDGADNGLALAAGSSGTLPYSYSWSTGASTANVSSLAPGSYGVTVTDGNSCTDTASVVIAAGAPISGTISATDITCAGDADVLQLLLLWWERLPSLMHGLPDLLPLPFLD